MAPSSVSIRRTTPPVAATRGIAVRILERGCAERPALYTWQLWVSHVLAYGERFYA